jgi:hypothetical protein
MAPERGPLKIQSGNNGPPSEGRRSHAAPAWLDVAVLLGAAMRPNRDRSRLLSKKPGAVSPPQVGFNTRLAYNKPIASRPEIGAQLVSFNFLDRLIWVATSSAFSERRWSSADPFAAALAPGDRGCL